MTLDQLKPGQQATINSIRTEKLLRRRLMDLGLTRGTKISFVKEAPLGDPLEFKVLDYHLAMRRAEARLIEITY